jgi:hypothetical protein
MEVRQAYVFGDFEPSTLIPVLESSGGYVYRSHELWGLIVVREL